VLIKPQKIQTNNVPTKCKKPLQFHHIPIRKILQ